MLMIANLLIFRVDAHYGVWTSYNLNHQIFKYKDAIKFFIVKFILKIKMYVPQCSLFFS